jgi:3-phenylpropionate/cinnamic acid dioxygenase small subunit
VSIEPLDSTRVADRLRITDLLARYCEALDDYDFDDVAACFTDDCVFDPGPGMGGERRGSSNVFPAQRVRMGRFRATQHQLGQSRIAFSSEDRATATTYVTAWHERWDGTTVTGRIRYIDVLARTSAGWRIAERRLVELGVEGMPTRTWKPSPRREVPESQRSD